MFGGKITFLPKMYHESKYKYLLVIISQLEESFCLLNLSPYIVKLMSNKTPHFPTCYMRKHMYERYYSISYTSTLGERVDEQKVG